MATNTTWEDLQARAKNEGWDWIDDNTNEWKWIWFGTHQDYRTDFPSGNVMTSAGIGFTYDYAELLLYNDTNSDMIMQPDETTHFFMPENVESFTFLSPGEAYGNFSDTGTIRLNLTDCVDYGVTLTGVNGTLFPYHHVKPTDMWGWWDGMVYGDFHISDFNARPTDSSLDLMSSDATSGLRTLIVLATTPTPFPTLPYTYYVIAAGMAIAVAMGAFALFKRKPPL